MDRETSPDGIPRRVSAWRGVALLLPMLLLACTTAPIRVPVDASPETLALVAAARKGGAAESVALAEHYTRQGDWRAEHWLKRASRHRPVDEWVARAEFERSLVESSGRLGTTRSAAPADAATRAPRPAEAKHLARRSAAHGWGYAMGWLSYRYEDEGNHPLAARWTLRHAMTDGDVFLMASARSRIGGLKGWAAPATPESRETLRKLAEWLKREAARGDAEALVDLGLLYHIGAGVTQDQAAAMDCFDRAAARGNVFGMYFAGLLIVRGWLPDQPREAAAPWFRRAYAKGFHQAAEPAWREIHFKFPDFSS